MLPYCLQAEVRSLITCSSSSSNATSSSGTDLSQGAGERCLLPGGGGCSGHRVVEEQRPFKGRLLGGIRSQQQQQSRRFLRLPLLHLMKRSQDALVEAE